MIKKIIFSGCSYTAGNGWTDTDPEESAKIETKDCPHLWVNLCHTHLNSLKNLELINLGQGGASNTDIFTITMRAMSEHGHNIDTIICQWTSMPRYNWNVGFELWDTSENIPHPDAKHRKHDVNLNRGDHWTRDYINDLTDRLRVLHHLHWEILKVVDYSHVIHSLAHKLGIANVYFINGLCPWDQDYFTRLENVFPEQYTEFTKTQILNINNRDDQEIHALYKLAHDQYQQKGGIKPQAWINLYQSFHNLRIDHNHDGQHPGIQSNLVYYRLLQSRLQPKNDKNLS